MDRVLLLGVFLGSVLLLSQPATGRVQIKESLVEEWMHHLRPGMMPFLEKKIKEAEARRHNDADKYLDRDLSMFDIIRMYMEDHGSEIDSRIVAMFREFAEGTAPLPPDAGKLTCPYTPQCPSTPAASKDIVGKWRKFTETVQDPSSCQPCQTFIEALVETACETEWEVMRDNLINVCEDLLFPLLNLDPVMCNGSITLQGEHLYCVLKEASSFEACESLNLCYPPDPVADAKPPVSERTPWALKDTLQPKLQQEIADRHKKRTKRQSGVINIVQLTDIHMQMKYSIGAPADCKAAICCLEDSLANDGTENARKWGEYSCNVPERTMVKFLEKVQEYNPAFVIYAGDSPPHTLWDETLNSQINCSNLVVSAMKNALPAGLKVYPAIGNHEMYPTNLYSKRMTDTADMTAALTSMWTDIAGFDQEAIDTFSDMSYFTMLHSPGLRIMTVNSNYDWYTANFYNSLNKNDSANEQHMAWVESTLAQARAAGEKVVIITHHPVHSGTVRSIRWWQEIASEYSDVIALHVSGHTHKDELDLILDPITDECKGVNLVAPTVTTNTNINPSLRVFQLDDTTFELLEADVYHFDLENQNPDVDPEIVLSYSAKTDYGMVDLTPASWQNLVFRFIDDEVLFQTYYDNRRSQAPSGPCAFDDVCGESCKISTICGIWFPSPDESDECEDSWNFTMAARAAEAPEPVAIYSGAPAVEHLIYTIVAAASLLMFML